MDYRSFYPWSQSWFVVYGTSAVLATTLIFLWGILVGPVSVVWSTWVAGKAPEQAETAGGLFIASIQLAAAVGALSRGFAFDAWGSVGVFALSSACWLLSALST